METKRSNDLYKTKYYSLTNFLQLHKNNSEDYEDVRYYEPCLISSEKETKAFKYLIIEKDDISFCENPPKSIVKAIKMKDILSVSLDYEESFLSGVEKEFTHHIVIKYFNQSKLNRNESKKLKNHLNSSSKSKKNITDGLKTTTSLPLSLVNSLETNKQHFTNSLETNKQHSKSDNYMKLFQKGMTLDNIEKHLGENLIYLFVPSEIQIVKPALSIHARYSQSCEYPNEEKVILNEQNTEREGRRDKKENTLSYKEKFPSDKDLKTNKKKPAPPPKHLQSRVSIGALHIYTIKDDSMLYGLLKNSFETVQLISTEKASRDSKPLESRDVQQLKDDFEGKKRMLLADPTNHSVLNEVINMLYHYPFLLKLCWRDTHIFDHVMALMKNLLDLHTSFKTSNNEEMLVYIQKHIIQTLASIEILMRDSEYIHGFYIHMSTALKSHLDFILHIVMYEGFCGDSVLEESKMKVLKEFEEEYLIGGINLLYMLLQNISLLKVLPQSSAPEFENVCELICSSKLFNSFLKRMAEITTKAFKETNLLTKPLYAKTQAANRRSEFEDVSTERSQTFHYGRYTTASACFLHRCLSIMSTLMDSNEGATQATKKLFSTHFKYFVDISQVLSQLPSSHNIFMLTSTLLTNFHNRITL